MKKQTMRFCSVVLCILMTLSSFSVLTAFADETKTDNSDATQSTKANQNDDRKYSVGCIPLTEEELAEIPKIESVEDYYEVLAEEQGDEVATYSLDENPSATLPSSVDNSKSKYFPPVGDQGSLGSCTTWAEIYYQMSYAENVALDRTATYDNCCSPIWIYNFANRGMNTGASIIGAFSLAKSIGVPSLKNSPNTSVLAKWTATREAYTEAQKYKVKNYQLFQLETNNSKTPITNPNSEVLDPIKTALNNNELVTYSIYAHSFVYDEIQKNDSVPENSKYAGETVIKYSDGEDGYHRMCIVGYNDNIWCDINRDGKVQQGEKGAFKVVNSWGEDWCDNGFAWISYDALNTVSSVPDTSEMDDRYDNPIFHDLMRVSVKPISDCSNINLEYTLKATHRDQIRVQIVATDKTTNKNYSGYSEPFASYLTESGNNCCSFDGTKNESQGTFAYDLNSIVSGINSSNLDNYTWSIKFMDTYSDANSVTVCDARIVDNNNNNSYVSDLGAEATINGSSKTVSVDIEDIKPLSINSFNFDNANEKDAIPFHDNLKISTAVSGGKAPYQYKFSYKQYNEEHILQDFSTKSTCESVFDYTGTYEIKLTVKDALGETVTTSKSLYVIQTYISSMTTDKDVIKVGDTTNISADIQNLPSVVTYSDYSYSVIDKDGNTTALTTKSDRTADWTPKTEGEYDIKLVIEHNGKYVAGKTIDVNVEKGAETNGITIYYKGYSTPYIHYQVGNGSWTSVPGYKMAESSVIDGYTHEYTIDLGTSTYANVCFNNGNGSWDSRNGQNYRFEKGTYTYKNGTITPVEDQKFGIKSFDITPADGKITEGDTIQMDVTLKNATSSAVIKYTYVDTSGNEITIYDYSTATSAKKQINYAGTYKVRAYAKESYFDTEYVMEEKTVVVSSKNEFKFESAFVTPSDEVTAKNVIGIYATVTGGVEPYSYEYGYTQDNKTVSQTSSSAYQSFTVEKGGSITPYVKVTDATGKTITKTFSAITVKYMKINSIITNPQSPQYVDTKINIKADIENAAVRYGMYGSCTFSISKDGKVVETLTDNYNATVDWTPTQAGTYTITCDVADYYGQKATKTINYVINDKNTIDNSLTIYYKGYSTPYIHYQVGNGSWTSAPGYKMAESSVIDGYTHEYTIDLGTSTYANVCFNNGNGSWDSRNGQNYRFEKGTYTFKNGTITPVEDQKFGIKSFDITPADGKITVGDTIQMGVTLKNATSSAVIKYTYVDTYENEITIYDYSTATSAKKQFSYVGTYKVRAYAKESYFDTDYVMVEKTVTVAEKQPLTINSFDVNSSNGVVPFYENVKMSANVSGGKAPYQYRFSYTQYGSEIIIQDFSADSVCTKQFSQVGSYTLNVMVKDADGTIVTQSTKLTVVQGFIEKINLSKTSANVGDTIKITPVCKNMPSVVNASNYEFTVTKDGKTEKLTTNSDCTANWTPTEAGAYKITASVMYEGRLIAGLSVSEYEVEKKATNQLTIYYKGYSTPYIHYQVGNGSWTQVPGVAMTATSEKSGYTHKYTIDLGTSSYANVCFNNGNGSWDSRNGQNYYFEKGTYTYSNGQMTKIAD